MNHNVKSPRKLIEVALPLDAINAAAAREKSIRHGHPSALHLWWARRPLAAARAVIFAQLVNDPSWKWEMDNPGKAPPGHLKGSWAASRKRLFKIIEDLVQWENTTNEQVLERARNEIYRSWHEVCELNKDHPKAREWFNRDHLPALHDPFCGGGAIPLEAQRLGLEAYASDLNPVAVLITKAMIEIPLRFSGQAPVGPFSVSARERLGLQQEWPYASGLAEDVRRYGVWMREEAQKCIGRLYPPIEITSEMARERTDLKELVGEKLTVIAWLWARTVKSPNPAFSHVDIPLISTFILSSKAGKEAFVHPVLRGDEYRFEVKVGTPPPSAKEGTKASGRGANFRCIVSNVAVSGDYIKAQGQNGCMGARLLAIVAEGPRGRVFLAPNEEMENIARKAISNWKPSGQVPPRLTGGTCVPYGLKEWGDLFSTRQLLALTTLTELVQEVKKKVRDDAVETGMPDDGKPLHMGGKSATAYAEAISVYLTFLISQIANHSSTICGWNHPNTQMRSVFSRQAIPMTWDYAEANIFSNSSGSYLNLFDRQVEGMSALGLGIEGKTFQADAQSQTISECKIISTDPPYYDNIAYADLSDFFYVWMRRSLRDIFPEQFSTIAVPKAEELVASAYRHGNKDKAQQFFLAGMTRVMQRLAEQANLAFPVTIYYAFKQSDSDSDNDTASSTGWETFLGAVIRAGFAICGTWPMRTEKEGRSVGIGTNALASSIILVCRKRPIDAPTISRREFLRQLNEVLPEALDEMTKGAGEDRSPVAPVDLSQAVIGPGMAIFSQYAAVLEADGSNMSVRTALHLINRFLAEDDFDADTQFCLHWFEQNGWKEGLFGDADTLSRAKGTSADGLRDAGIVESGGGVVRLLRWSEYPMDWDPESDRRNSVWETLHHMIRALKQRGESESGHIYVQARGKTEAARQLAYRLYTLCERKGWAEDARAYNEIITSWSGIETAASAVAKPAQGELFEQDI